MSRRIQKHKPHVFSLQNCLFGENRNAALSFQMIGIQKGVLMIDTP